MMPPLRPYQAQIGRAVLDSVLRRRGLTLSVELARQGGKNELSAQLGVLLLALHFQVGGAMVKAAPTFLPQAMISMARLKERLNDAGLAGLWASEAGHILRLGNARQAFLSAAPGSNVVGATAHILLEVDEAQDVDREKFYKEFRPMGASTNVTTVLYGTPWNDVTLLEEVKQLHLEMERRDGVQRHFRFDWRQVAQRNPAYARYAEEERRRLGEDHPLFRTQYALLPLSGGGGLFSAEQQAQLQGHHPRQRHPAPGVTYVAGIDLAGSAEEPAERTLAGGTPRRDSTVVTIGELDFSACDELLREPRVKVVEHYGWTGVPHHQLYPRLVDLLQSVWRCRRVVVDATGVGAGVASFLQRALGRGVVTPFTFTAASKSRLGFDLLAAINTGRGKLYAHDGSPEVHEFWRQVFLCRSQYRADRTLNFYVEPSQGHDDFITSLALVVHAASQTPRVARGKVREEVASRGARS